MNTANSLHRRGFSACSPLRSLRQFCVVLLVVCLPLTAAGETKRNYHPDAIPLNQVIQEDERNGQTLAHPLLPEYYLAIYSGSTMGVYFEVASRICELMRRTHSQHHIRCVPLRSNGATDNLRLMQEGRAQVAIIQSDLQWNAAHGLIDMPDARSVASLHNEMGLLVVRSDAHIESVADLRGKRINMTPEGSASYRLWSDLLAAHGITIKALGKTYNAIQDFNKSGVCLDHIDAYGIWMGHPAKMVTETLTSCDTKVIGMRDRETDRMLVRSQFLFKQTLPANVYPGQTEPIESYGLKATLVAAKQANPYVIYWLTRIVHENAETLRNMHPALNDLNANEMRDLGNFMPFHDGAGCYWRPRAETCEWKVFYPNLREIPVK